MHYMGGIGLIELLVLLFVALICAAVVAAVVWLIIRSASHRPQTSVSKDARPLDILRERYARGEITKEQYDEMREHLSS